MFLPSLPNFKARKALVFLPQPELYYFKESLSLKHLTTYLGIKIFQASRALVCGPLFSAQLAGFLFELLAKAEVKRILFLGWGGALNKSLRKGDLFLPKKAYSRLGLVKELYPQRKVFYPSKLCLKALETELAGLNLTYKVGTILSVDYPILYERGKNIPKRQKPDVLDMEASAFFALGEYFHIDVSGLIFITDRVGELTQKEPQSLKILRRRILPLFKAFTEKDE